MKRCPICEAEVPPRKTSPRVYCSSACRIENGNRRNKERYYAQQQQQPKLCACCGRYLESRLKRSCSDSCEEQLLEQDARDKAREKQGLARLRARRRIEDRYNPPKPNRQRAKTLAEAEI